MPPDTAKGPEAVMNAIDEWLDYQDHQALPLNSKQ